MIIKRLTFNVNDSKRLILILLTVLAILFAGASLVKSWKQPQIKVAWNYTKPISCSTRLSGNQKIVKNQSHQRQHSRWRETLGSSNTAISRGTKGSEEFESFIPTRRTAIATQYHSATPKPQSELLYKRLPSQTAATVAAAYPATTIKR